MVKGETVCFNLCVFIRSCEHEVVRMCGTPTGSTDRMKEHGTPHLIPAQAIVHCALKFHGFEKVEIKNAPVVKRFSFRSILSHRSIQYLKNFASGGARGA